LDEIARHVRIDACRAADRVQRVEEEVWIDLLRQSVEPGAHRHLLLLFERHLEPGVVPDLDRDAERDQIHQPHGADHDDAARLEAPQHAGAELARQQSAGDVEPEADDADDDRHEVAWIAPAQQAIDVHIRVRRILPAETSRARQPAQSAADQAAENRERQRQPLAAQRRRTARHDAGHHAGDRTGEQSSEQRTGWLKSATE
jgi:hypothetical protein